jgi:hypothetical protein
VGKKAKQWASLGLPAVADDREHSPWFTKMLALKDERAALPVDALADEYNEVEDELAIIDARRSELTALQEALDRLILAYMDNQKIEKLSLKGRTFSERIDIQPKVRDRQAFYAWLKETGQEDIFTVNHGNIKTIVKDALDPEVALSMTPAQRAAMQPGEAGSGQCPPGLEAATQRTLGAPVKR